jgi:hypothetical protein
MEFMTRTEGNSPEVKRLWKIYIEKVREKTSKEDLSRLNKYLANEHEAFFCWDRPEEIRQLCTMRANHKRAQKTYAGLFSGRKI